MTNVQNQAPFPGHMFPPDPLIITLVCYNTQHLFWKSLPSWPSRAPLCCVSFWSLFSSSSNRDANPQWPSFGCQNTQGPLGFWGMSQSNAFSPCGKDIPSEMYGVCVTLGHPGQAAILLLPVGMPWWLCPQTDDHRTSVRGRPQSSPWVQ